MLLPVLAFMLAACSGPDGGEEAAAARAAGGAATFTPEPGNLVANPSFEEPGWGGPSGDEVGVGSAWETVCGGPHPEVYSIDEAAFRSGLRSQRMRSDLPYNYDSYAPVSGRFCYHLDDEGVAHKHPRATALGNQAISQSTSPGSVIPGRRYRAGAWVKTRGLAEDWEWLRLGFSWLDEGGSSLGEVRQDEPGTPLLPVSDWHLVTCEGVAPEGALASKVYLHHHFVHGTVWFDDVYFVELPGE